MVLRPPLVLQVWTPKNITLILACSVLRPCVLMASVQVDIPITQDVINKAIACLCCCITVVSTVDVLTDAEKQEESMFHVNVPEEFLITKKV